MTFNTWGFLPKSIEHKVAQGGVIVELAAAKDQLALDHFDFLKRFPHGTSTQWPGQSAYASLVTQNAALQYMKDKNVGLGASSNQFTRVTAAEVEAGSPEPVEIVEIGC